VRSAGLGVDYLESEPRTPHSALRTPHGYGSTVSVATVWALPAVAMMPALAR